MRRRRRHLVYEPYADPELQHEAEVLRMSIKAVLKELDVPTLQTIMRVVRYAEEGKTAVAVTLEDLRDPWQCKLLLDIYTKERAQASKGER